VEGAGATGPPAPCRADWLIVAQLQQLPSLVVDVDLEVLAMLSFDLKDRRLLGEPHGFGPPPPSLHPCLFIHDLRVASGVEADKAPVDGIAVVNAICEACGSEVLLEAFELSSE
ncbi:unnamed protein product, partial [Polarella glacialis]